MTGYKTAGFHARRPPEGGEHRMFAVCVTFRRLTHRRMGMTLRAIPNRDGLRCVFVKCTNHASSKSARSAYPQSKIRITLPPHFPEEHYPTWYTSAVQNVYHIEVFVFFQYVGHYTQVVFLVNIQKLNLERSRRES